MRKPRLYDKTEQVIPETIQVGDYLKYIGSGETQGERTVLLVRNINITKVKGITLYHFNSDSRYRLACRSDKTVEKYT